MEVGFQGDFCLILTRIRQENCILALDFMSPRLNVVLPNLTLGLFYHILASGNAEVAELADAHDSKSCGLIALVGSIPSFGIYLSDRTEIIISYYPLRSKATD